MARNVPIDKLAEEIGKAVGEYTEEVAEAIADKIDKTADAVVTDARSNAPKHSGKYAKGFTKTKRDGAGSTRRIIWNKKDYRRVHLLEFGHAKVRGGRVRAYPHLRPAYEKHAEQLTEDIKRIIKNGGGS
ncbi:HK97 gp10 family phage protein [Paenibacillus sp. KR2-11]|uniref:HK97 gp10 family phage protein n=1 Tax=Paenibacillus sp. KR2-11 TaxID=3385500 RepID=UPI0038FC977E